MALTGGHRRLVPLLLLACLAASLLAARPARASQPPAAGLLATATGAVDRATGQIASAPAGAAAQVLQSVPRPAGATTETAGVVEKAAQPVVSGAGDVVHGAVAPVRRRLDSAAGTVRDAPGIVAGARTVGTEHKVLTPPSEPASPGPAHTAERPPPAPTAGVSQPAAAVAAPHQSSPPKPPAPALAREVPAPGTHSSIASHAAPAFHAASAPPATAPRPSRAAPPPGHPIGHGPLRLPVPGGNPGSSLSAPGGGIAFVLVLFGLLLAWPPKLTRRLRPSAVLLSGARHVLILDRPG